MSLTPEREQEIRDTWVAWPSWVFLHQATAELLSALDEARAELDRLRAKLAEAENARDARDDYPNVPREPFRFDDPALDLRPR